jgi:hypothetical protein
MHHLIGVNYRDALLPEIISHEGFPAGDSSG